MTEKIHPEASRRMLATAQAIQKGVARWFAGGRFTEGVSSFESHASRWDEDANQRE